MFEEMIQKHQAEFDSFQRIHDKYKADQSQWKDEFDTTGKPLVRIIEETENRLCSRMENTSRGKYSNNLADKFRSLVRTRFPLIDFVGVTIS